MPKIVVGDSLAVLRRLPPESIQCCVTSPPYFGLRDYGHVGQIGLEETPDAYVQKLVEVFREVRRVLKKDGTCWVNLGDSFNAAGRTGHGTRQGYKQGTNRASATKADNCRPSVDYLKPKDLIGIPWMVAFALRADGWYLRQDIIWSKPNPMPESVKDRCTKAHEYIFLLSKSERYFYDSDVIREPLAAATIQRDKSPRGRSQNGGKSDESLAGYDYSRQGLGDMQSNPKGRNRRSVWTVATKPYKEAHFATFPPDLIEPCILAGCPEGGVVLDPFGGSGTTGEVAKKHGRRSILIELNPKYADLAAKRTGGVLVGAKR